jgi:hypothetical protein
MITAKSTLLFFNRVTGRGVRIARTAEKRTTEPGAPEPAGSNPAGNRSSNEIYLDFSKSKM